MRRFFPPEPNYQSLSVKDLLEARDAYHVYLTNLENVIGTAIGKYRIKLSDPDMQDPLALRARPPRKSSTPRTLANSIVTSYSWPCLLVFVNRWATAEELRDRPDQFVPSLLYMPDGRIIPTCVIYAPKKESAPPPLWNLNFPSELVGGGYPIFTEVQDEQHVASIGCLVTDGDLILALTNKHVTGEKLNNEQGREIYTLINGQRIKIGNTYYRQAGKRLFQQVYPSWGLGSRTYSNLDVGTISIDSVQYWSAQVFGIGEIDDPVDLHTNSISLDLINCPVRAFGCASGEMLGKIEALFYRYKSIGGFDYVSDLLIGQLDEKTPLRTQPGDSGTVWFYDPRLLPEEVKKRLPKEAVEVRKGDRSSRLRPIALQWGGQTIMDNQSEAQIDFALATSVSTILRELDLDLVRGWNIGHSEYWGKVGHYKIAAKACSLVSNLKLKKLMSLNLRSISFNDEEITEGKLKRIDPNQLVPLADVPDLVWRTSPQVGQTRRSREEDSGNHFADMDQEGKGPFEGKTLLDLTKQPENVDVKTWNSFYDSLGIGKKRGALPFRVWQIYSEMVNFVNQKDPAKFVCAAGILAHYVADACQPLHVSQFHDGRPDRPEEKGVHSYYETKMLDRFAVDIIGKINNGLESANVKADFKGGKNGAISVIELMQKCIKLLPPLEIIKAYNERKNSPRNRQLRDFFETVSKSTISCMVEGCLRLASLWESAWKEGNGNKIPENRLIKIQNNTLIKLYTDKSFLTAYRLEDPEFLEVLK